MLVRVDETKMADVVAETTANLTEEGEGFKITSSVGIVVLPDEADDTTEALKVVDRRMYRHKGGDRPVGAEGRGALLGVLEARDAVLAAHTNEVVRLSRAIACRIPYDFSIETVVSVAQLHDIGKLADAGLDPLQARPARAERMGCRSPAHACRRAHRRPRARAGRRRRRRPCVTRALGRRSATPTGSPVHDIPLSARIVAVADAYAAMTTPDRPYREPLSEAEAEEEIIRCAGTQFDPIVVEAFLAVLADDRATSVQAA